MANTIKIKNSVTPSNAPSSLEYGELAINVADEKLFYKNSSSSIENFDFKNPLTSTFNLDTSYTETGNEPQGSIYWNDDEETINLVQNGAVLQLGQELQVHCRNNSGSTISNGTVCMATGTIGASGRITIAPYDGTSDVKYIIGIATEDILNDDDGKVTTFGKVRGLDTSSFSEGTVLYTTTNGGLTSTEPTSGVKNAIAFVVTSSATVGTLMVRFTPIDENNVGGGASVEISDTPPSSPAEGTIWWDSSSGSSYVYYNDGDSSQWVSLGTQGTQGIQGEKGDIGESGLTPIYEFTYNNETGDLEYALVGHQLISPENEEW